MFCDPVPLQILSIIICFIFFEMGLTFVLPIWTMSLNILLLFFDGTPFTSLSHAAADEAIISQAKFAINISLSQ